jgi:aryl-alcohol dehydrogenase-like predicted oxidoreductase/nucleoside-diphosphate-sugar epimerase
VNVLVVGGSRFVGLEVVNRLLLEGHEVSVLALDPLPPELAPYATWLHADRNDRAALTKALQGKAFEAVVDNIAYEAAQVQLLAELVGKRLRRYVLTSSVDVYGLSHPRSFREDQAPLEPHDTHGTHGHERYMRGKRACEIALKDSGIAWTVLRPCIVTGRRDNVTAPPGVRHLGPGEQGSRSTFLPVRVLDGGPLLLREDDEGVFRLVWVQDVARAAAMVLTDPRMANEAFNVTGDEAWTTDRLVRALCAAAGRTPELVRVSARELETAGLSEYEAPYGRGPYWSVASNEKLRALGWSPTPAEAWLPKLVEAAHGAGGRPFAERRLAEIALGHHLRRRRLTTTVVDPLPLETPAPVAALLEGRVETSTPESVHARHPRLDPLHFRAFGDTALSSLGLGTWMGDLTAATDAMYVDAIVHAVQGGLNVVDTAINYRHMRSERAVGMALRRLESLGIRRRNVFVATKGGFLTHDAGDARAGTADLRAKYVARGLLDEGEAARGHAISAGFIEAQLAQSLANLRLAQVDLYFLHNPELARAALGPKAFEGRLTETFAMLEAAVAAGRIGAYGLATWEGLRVDADHPQHLSLETMARLARVAAGSEEHHFRAVQLPFNASQAEARRGTNQRLHGQQRSALEAAKELGIGVFTSATLHQGALDAAPPVAGLGGAAAAAQFARSTPGVTCALIGMRRVAHVAEALAVAALPPLAPVEIEALARPAA